ncbi:mitochondrial carrier homolog 1 isoform X6 [Oxyura jamaicensis]|uniref:mitochondrial carrier homolog 1 isoform X6 n=1 Tax=Oxyura jamaicensis TaxID=8884 RepID=UPI0015A6C86A|nr:mitochondrial carrier homolog 1 isoform X6 [Oxyura jamaicensis]
MANAALLPPEARTPPGGGPPSGPGRAEGSEGTEGLFVVLGAGLAAASHPLLYVKLLVQVGHEPLPPAIGRNVLGKKVLYLPGFFTYASHIVKVDGKRGLFRGLTPRLISSTLSTITRGSVKKAFPLEDMEHVSNKDDMKTSLRKVVKETSHEMMMQCVSRAVSHPLHDCYEHADIPIPSCGRPHGSEQLWVACWPPSLCTRVHILDPLLEVSQCPGEGVGYTQVFGLPLLFPKGSALPTEYLCCTLYLLGAAVPWLQPAIPQSACASSSLPHRLTPACRERR